MRRWLLWSAHSHLSMLRMGGPRSCPRSCYEGWRKGAGKEAKLCFMRHALMGNRSGLLVGACLTRADGHAERMAALAMIEPHAPRSRPITLGADKGYRRR